MSKKELTIGSKIFVVHKDYSGKRKPGGKVFSARVIAFENINHVIVPIFKISHLAGPNVNSKNYDYFVDIKLAINAIIS